MEDNRQSNENIISQLWSRYFPYWPVFLVLTAMAVGGAWIYLQYKLPVYKASATLLVKDEKKGIEESKIMESLNPLSTKKIIENEIEVIKSRALMAKVVEELNLYAPVYQKGEWVDIPAYDFSPVRIEVRNPDKLAEAKKVEFSFEPQTQTVLLRGQKVQPDTWVQTPWGELKFLLHNAAYQEKAPLYFSLVNPKKTLSAFSGKLDVTAAGKLSSVLYLTLKDEVPKRAEDILNALINAYDRASVADKNSLAANTLSFLDERLKYVSGDLDSIEKAIQHYRANKGAIDISSQGKLFLQNVSDNDQKLSEVNMKLSVLGQVEEYVASNNIRGGLVPSTLGINDPLLSNLLNKLYDAELQYDKLKLTTGENNPELSSLADQIRKLKPSILENVRSQKRSLDATKANLYQTNNSYGALLSALPKQERDLVEISREQNIKSSIYSFLLQRREETALSHSATVADTRVVDYAESSLTPVGLGGKIIYGAAIFLALGLGIVIITAREMLNRTVLFRQEIEALTRFPVIGEIVAVKGGEPVVIKEGQKSFVAEQFRLLRTSLPYLGIGPRNKKLLITSTISGEGKSFLATNLALSLAIGGKKVVLVEFDLSNPTLGEKLNIEANLGVADYLLGDAEPEEIIKRTGESANLFLIQAGNLPSNPSELILSDRTEELLQYLEKIFDYVIVDSAPVGLLSDGYVLAKHCDATLYVVRHKYTPKKMLERLDDSNKINELKNIALVFNGIKSRGFGPNKYGYGYGYGYLYVQEPKKVNTNTV